MSKLTDIQVIEIRKLYQTKKYRRVTLSKMFSISGTNISDIINYNTWQHVQ
jgi:hypothetical protein